MGPPDQPGPSAAEAEAAIDPSRASTRFARARAACIAGLGHRHAARFAILLGLLLASPSLGGGLAADDWFHRLVLTGSDVLGGVHHRPLDMFVFSNGDPKVGHAQQESGMLPWWADPNTAIAYFRPLSALTHWADYQLWPDSTFAMHLQNWLWFALALVMLARVYRSFIEPAWVSVLALLLYAVDDAHGFVISWIANRNALIALVLGLFVLELHARARSERSAAVMLAAAAVFLVALLAGESAVAVGGYLIAFALFVDRAPLRARVASLLPYAVVFVGWRLVYAALGYGTHGSGLAVDPVNEPFNFAVATIVRLPVLLIAQFAMPPADLWELFVALTPWLQPAVYACALLGLALLAGLLAESLRTDRMTRFWALGTVLSALPTCAQVPSDRLLLFVGVGAQALVAQLLAQAVSVQPPAKLRGFALGGAIGLFVLHLVIAPIALVPRSRGAQDVRSLLSLADRTVPGAPPAQGRTLVLVNPPGDPFAAYIPMMRAADGRAQPGTVRWLATGASAAHIARRDARTLRVELDDGFMSLASERMQRSTSHPMHVGERVELSGLTVTIERLTSDARPKLIEARFELPLEDPRLMFLQWTTRGYAPFAVPALGQTVTLPAVDFMKLRIYDSK